MIQILRPLIGTGLLLGTCVIGISMALEQSQTSSGLPSDLQVEPAPGKTGNAVVALPQARPDVYYAAITQRPLFAPTRRPFVDTPDATPEPVVEPEPVPVFKPQPFPIPSMKLLGVMQTGQTDRAYFSIGDADPVWASEGQSISGWTLNEVTPETIELSRGSDRVTLEMFEQ